LSTPDESAHLVESTIGTQTSAGQSHVDQLGTAAEVNPNNPPWGLVAGFLVWLGSVALLIVLQLLFVLPYTATNFKGGDKDALTRFLTTDKTAVLLEILSLIPTHLLTILVVWAVVTHFGKRPFWRSLGWSWGKKFGFWSSVGLGIGLYVLAFILIYFIGGVNTSFDQTVTSSRTTALTIAFLAFATAPLAEELVYRGVLYSALHKKIGVYGAVIGVLLLFTAVHVPQYWPDYGRIGVLGILSLTLTLVRARTGRLLPCFIIHSVFNGIQSALILAEPYLPHTPPDTEQKVPAIAMLAKSVLHFF
jgi:membrane protease YdiL (CAAX protease family)